MGFIWGLARGGPTNGGLLFALDGLGNFNVAHVFGAEAGDGVDPNPGLTLEGANLYGTTISGGAFPGLVKQRVLAMQNGRLQRPFQRCCFPSGSTIFGTFRERAPHILHGGE